MENGLLILWIAAMVIFVMIEALTVELITIWFALGSLGALIANLAGAGTQLQFAVFIVVSVVVLLTVRPIVKRVLHKDIQPTNADRCIGQTALVTEEIDNIKATGLVKVGGIEWTARASGGEVIPLGENVLVERIEGVKVFVQLSIN